MRRTSHMVTEFVFIICFKVQAIILFCLCCRDFFLQLDKELNELDGFAVATGKTKIANTISCLDF
jgi:hypothetical protein